MLINDTQAALHLGITKELLFAFVTKGYNGKKLVARSNDGNKFFDSKDLNEWDSFLNLPLTKSAEDKKPAIPLHIREYLKIESKGKCSRCGSGHRLDNAHIIPWCESFSHHPHNLIRLCTDCHTKYDDEIISREEIKKLKDSLIQNLRKENSDVDFVANPHSIPKTSKHFQDRKEELQKLRKMASSKNVVIIEGVGGIGKTQLLINFLEDKSVDWFNIDVYAGYNHFYSDFLSFYGAKDIENVVNALNINKKILVLDGIENIWRDNNQDKVTAFLIGLFSKAKECKIFITTQFNYLDVDPDYGLLKITDGLDKQFSFELLKFQNPSLEQDADVLKLLNFADGHPLTLNLISGLILHYGSPSNVRKFLQQSGVSILENPNKKFRDHVNSLNACLNSVFDMLDEKQKWLLGYLSMFQCGFKSRFIEVLMQEKRFHNSAELHSSLSLLRKLNLIRLEVDSLGFEKAKFLYPVRSFVRNKIGNSSRKLFHELQSKAFQHLVFQSVYLYMNYMSSNEIQYAMLRYEVDLPNYLFAFKKSLHSAYCDDCNKYSLKEDYLRIITGLSTGLYKYLFTRGNFSLGIELNKQGAKAHIELKEYDLAIDDLVQVATLYWRINNLPEAKKALNQMIECEKLSGTTFSTVRLIEAHFLAKKNPTEAIAKYEEGIKICEDKLKIDANDLSSKGNIGGFLMEIGRIYERNLNDCKTALSYYLKSYHIQREMQDFANMLCNAHHIGNCYAEFVDIKKSLLYYREALEGFVRLGMHQYISNTLSEIGKLRLFFPDEDFSFLTKKILVAGLEDLTYEMQETFMNGDDDKSNGDVNFYLLLKLWHVIHLVSFSKHSSIFKNWAENLAEMLLAKEAHPCSLPLQFLRIAVLLHTVQKKKNNAKKLIELKESCYLNGSEVDFDIFQPYEFLSLWLKEKGIENISAGRLYWEIEKGGYF